MFWLTPNIYIHLFSSFIRYMCYVFTVRSCRAQVWWHISALSALGGWGGQEQSLPTTPHRWCAVVTNKLEDITQHLGLH